MKLTWSTRDYETGIDRGVLYVKNGSAETWDGLISVQENDEESENQVRYVDGVKIQNRRRLGEFSGVIESFTHPKALYDDPVLYRRRPNFGLTYRTQSAHGHRIHILYNVLTEPLVQQHQQTEVSSLMWSFSTTAVSVPGCRPSSHLIIDTTNAYSETVLALEDLLYGTESSEAHLPTPDEIFEVFEENSILRVVDHGDGTFTVTGPDAAIQMLNPTTFEITWPTAVYVNESTYTIRSL